MVILFLSLFREWRRQLGLVEHDDIRLPLADEPVKVALLLSRIDAAYIP